MADGPLTRIETSLDVALVVVTVAARGRRDGCLVGFHSQASIEPFRYSLWLSKANLTYELALFADVLAVHFLQEGDEDLAALFGGHTGDDVDKLSGCATTTGPGGVPLIERCANRMVVRTVATLDAGGDHVCFVTSPESVAAGAPFAPLRLGEVDGLSPGHEAAERRTGPAA